RDLPPARARRTRGRVGATRSRTAAVSARARAPRGRAALCADFPATGFAHAALARRSQRAGRNIGGNHARQRSRAVARSLAGGDLMAENYPNSPPESSGVAKTMGVLSIVFGSLVALSDLFSLATAAGRFRPRFGTPDPRDLAAAEELTKQIMPYTMT